MSETQDIELAHDEADADVLSGSDGSNGADEPATAPSNKQSHARRAAISLRRARRSYEEVEWQASERAAFHIAEANVLAMLDLAQAIRDTRGTDSAD